jgi:hypothetical protein
MRIEKTPRKKKGTWYGRAHEKRATTAGWSSVVRLRVEIETRDAHTVFGTCLRRKGEMYKGGDHRCLARTWFLGGSNRVGGYPRNFNYLRGKVTPNS